MDPVHPSTLYPGGVGTVATPQLFTDYMARLLGILDFVKKAVPMNDDIFDFFYEALPVYEEVGNRRTLLGCWGSFMNPADFDNCDYRYMERWGREMFVTPGVVVDGTSSRSARTRGSWCRRSRKGRTSR